MSMRGHFCTIHATFQLHASTKRQGEMYGWKVLVMLEVYAASFICIIVLNLVHDGLVLTDGVSRRSHNALQNN